jgi:hypothetical protein
VPIEELQQKYKLNDLVKVMSADVKDIDQRNLIIKIVKYSF